MKGLAFLAVFCVSACLAEVWFKEEFDDTWSDRWVQSKHKDDYGKFESSSGIYYDDKERDQGIKTSQDARFYALSTKFKKFSNRGKPLVVQFTVKHEQTIDCGGGYIKLSSSDVDPADFNGETSYKIMFGPDICGPSNRKVHVIIEYKGKNHLIKKNIGCKYDELSHLYTLIIKPDNTYEVQIDGEKVEGGELEADWDLLPVKKIKDPDVSKPEDWDDTEFIPDPEDKKPENWDQPEHIPDPAASKPDDWDEDMDGQWEAPLVDNPDYKGEWSPKEIKNPNYKGKWIHPEIDNPEYKADDELYLFDDIGVAAFDLWQVKSGTIFDNIIITDSIEEAKTHATQTFEPLAAAEKTKLEQHNKEKKEKEEAEEKAAEEENDKKTDKDDADSDSAAESDAEEHDEL